MLKSLSIENYKGFYDVQTLDFAIPDNTKKGSGLTLIVGPNNTGKTTIVEALLLTKDKKFKETERHINGGNPKISISNVAGVTTTYSNINSGSVIESTGGNHQINFELIPSRRYWSHQFNGQWEFGTLIAESSNSDIRSSSTFNLGPILKKILTTGDLKLKFDTYLKSIVPHFSDWTIDTNEANNDYIKYKTLDGWHQANMLGDGIISLFRVVAHLVHDQNSTFIIDEPELSLHPTAQKRLSQLISDLSIHKQIIVCTHSTYFANWNDFTNGGKIVRLNKRGGKCKIISLDNTKNYGQFIAQNIKEFEKPQLLDTVAKEILFSDKILFVEGQEDVGLIKKWNSDNSKTPIYEIFGYGVGGEGNMSLFFEMAKDLGIEKVAALFDSNSIKYKANVAAYSNFHLKQLPTEDIRDKVNKCVEECPYGKNRVGTFTRPGELKPDHKEAFDLIMSEMETFFK